MQNFEFYAPTRVIFGKDTQKEAGRLAKAEGASRAAVVYGGGSVERSGLLKEVCDSLSEAGVEYVLMGGAKPNPSLEHARECVLAAVEAGVDFVLAVGGGSAIDTAKAVAHGTANPDKDLWDIWCKEVPLEKSLPVGAVLTIPAAGSEMSDSAVLTNEETGKKRGINTEFNRCRFAVLNPALAASVPRYYLAAGVADIMMHTMERYFIPGTFEGLTDEIAEGLLRTMVKYGPYVLDHPDDADAMGEVMWCSSLSHNNLTECGRGKDFAVHKLGHALSARYGAVHGASLTAVWGSFAKALYKDAAPRFSRYARKVFGVDAANDEAAALAGIERTVDFFRSIGMPVSLAELGARPDAEELTALAMDATFGDSIKLSRIRPLGAAEVREIFEAAR